MIFEQLFLGTAFVGAIMALMNVIGANAYDAREIKKQRQYRLHPGARRYRNRPLVSVVILARDDRRSIGHCLQALAGSSYRKLEIIVVDNASRDGTKAIVKAFMADRPKQTIRLIAKRVAGKRSVAGNGANEKQAAAAYKRYGRGELIMVCEAATAVHPQAVSRAVRHFNTEAAVGVLQARSSVGSASSSAGLFQQYEQLLRYRAKKFGSVSNSDYAVLPAPGETAVYRRDSLLSLSKNLGAAARPGDGTARTYYASDVIVYTESLRSLYSLVRYRYRLQLGRLRALSDRRRLFFSIRRGTGYTKFLTWVRLPFAVCAGIAALCIPLLLSYFIYLAVRLHEPTLWLISWAALAGFLLFAVWGDDHFRWRQKAVYSLFVPITYLVFYVLSFVQVFVVLRGLLPQPKIQVK